jgi:hexosaminidase
MKYTSLIPLNRFVDAVRPESESVRALELAAKSGDYGPLREAFTLWAANDARFTATAEGNSLLTELKPLSKDLSALGTIGLEILDYLTAKKPAGGGWMYAQSREISRMERPSAEVKLAAVRPVKILLEELQRKSK